MESEVRELFPVNCIRLCFDSCDCHKVEGRICGITLEDDIEFHSMTELILRIDDVFNQIGQPQPHQILRSFGEAENSRPYNPRPCRYHSDREIDARIGSCRTVNLIMVSRKKAEWQGILKAVDGQIIGRFDSILACTTLLDRIKE